MTKSTQGPVRKYFIGAVSAGVMMFGGSLCAAGMSMADTINSPNPTPGAPAAPAAPAQAPRFTPSTPSAPAQAPRHTPMSPARPAEVPMNQAPGKPAPAPGRPAPARGSDRSGGSR
jgi:hypothetical protein